MAKFSIQERKKREEEDMKRREELKRQEKELEKQRKIEVIYFAQSLFDQTTVQLPQVSNFPLLHTL